MDSQIKNKLYDFEVNPPASAWAAINAQLDQEVSDKVIAQKMAALEAVPPAYNWEAIQKKLGAEEDTPVIPLNKNSRTLNFRRLAAAVVIAVAGISAIWLLNRRSDNSSGLAGIDPSSTQESIPADAGTVSGSTTGNNLPISSSSREDAIDQNASTASNTVVHSRRAAISRSALNNEPATSIRSQPAGIAHSTEIYASNALSVSAKNNQDADRYYNLLDENGNLIRVSKKLTALECVIKNGLVVPLDNSASKNADDECSQKLKEWHKLMTESPAITSPLDLLNLISSGG